VTADTTFPLTESQQAALAKIGCVVAQPGGVAVLCGPDGTGTTTVLGRLAGSEALRHREIGLRRLDGWAAEPAAAPLPDIVLADDAHEADAATILAFLGRCLARTPRAGVVLAGSGRLLTLIARDPRIEQVIRLRATLRPCSLAESSGLIAAVLAPGQSEAFDQIPVVRTIHEIAGGIPAVVARLSGLAALVAASRPDRAVGTADIEAIHRRLSLQAA
jgi:type II secretory pathway predicted ATPase ExeA